MSQQNSFSGIVGTLILGIAFFALGIGVTFFWGLPTLRTAKASETWPTTNGVVKESSVSRKKNKDSTTFAPEICYEYRVHGQKHFSSKMGIGGTTSYSSSAKAHSIANEYPVGSQVKVTYDPQNPGYGVLNPGLKANSYLPVVFGIVFLLIGLVMSFVPAFKLVAASFAIGSTLKSNSTQQNHFPNQETLPENPNSVRNTTEWQPIGAGANADEISEGFTIS